MTIGVAAMCFVASCSGGELPAAPAGQHETGRTTGRRTTLREGGEVIARVNGVAIGRSEVEALARESGVAPAIALERLIERELLV
ncbi:MAG: hypothetical protein IT379_00845, partial [Deltaproteobacteria bacterium]|nr:hypothetical protein [Deltaproteobacteria bacterium]